MSTPTHYSKRKLQSAIHRVSFPNACRSTAFLMAGLLCTAAVTVNAEEVASPSNAAIEELVITGNRETAGTTALRLPLTMRETPQSISLVGREMMDLENMTNIDDVMRTVTGVNVTLYDSQRPLYFVRGFQITDFQVDGIPTYSNSTNQEYDTALYERIEVVRGANGLLNGVGNPSATVNSIRKRPGREFALEISTLIDSWNKHRIVGDVNLPITSDGRVRSRLVAAYQDSDSYLDRYEEDKTAYLAIVEADITEATTLALGYQNQDNNPTGTIWGTIPIFAADGSLADMDVSTSFAPEWTRWQRESATLFAEVQHRFNESWTLRASYNRTEGDLFSLRAYASGFPDKATGEGTYLRAAVGETEDTRDSVDIYLTGKYTAFGREHDVMMGANASYTDSVSPNYDPISNYVDYTLGWHYLVPNAYDYNGYAPKPQMTKTGAHNETSTDLVGVYLATRIRATDALSLVLGARVTDWKTGRDNYDTNGNFANTTLEYEVDKEVTPYAGIVYDLNSQLSLYASYTDIFNPQNYRNINGDLLDPVIGSNVEAGIKGEFFDSRLVASAAIFNTKQDNYGVVAIQNHFPDDGGSAYKGVDGTESEGIELSISGVLNESWMINGGYTWVDTKRHENDKIWTNLPEHLLQVSTHYTFTDWLSNLTVGGGFNWQSKTVGYDVSHPAPDSRDFQQDPFFLINLHATWRFNENMRTTFSASNLFDETYWTNIDYANYGDPRNVSLSFDWKL